MTPWASKGRPGGTSLSSVGSLVASVLIFSFSFGDEGFCSSSEPSPLLLASYNVENYAVIPRSDGASGTLDSGKPESERNAVARVIADLHADIIGLMEIGDASQFDDLRARLKKTGIDYPHAEYVLGADPVRHLALLSRFPITERHSEGDIPLSVDGVTLHSPRGVLDVVIAPPNGKPIRILCVHLKAKLGVPEYNEARLREAEATALRKRIRGILHTDPASRLVVMGDLNDAPDSRTLREIEGKPEWSDSLFPAPLVDDRGESWTERWDAAEIYSRIDYILLSHSLERNLDRFRSGIFRPSYWQEASDHCPVFVTLKPER
jgi:endonuclease/exonuclease/phosphatase family metal-dependent hydrolase